MMNQHDFVKSCLEEYKKSVRYFEEGWEEAHYPAPKGVGTDTIWLTHEHHQIQGLLQSEEYGRMCFFVGHTLEFLKKGPFVSNWFELWDIYDKWTRKPKSESHRRKIGDAQLGEKNHKYGKPLSEEAKQKLRERNSGEGNPFFGKTHSEATKQKLREPKSGKNNHFYGKSHSEEHRRKIGEAQTGEKNHMYGKTGEKHHMYGKTHNQEARRKIKEALTGRYWWVNSAGETRLQVDPPGENWQKGRKWKSPEIPTSSPPSQIDKNLNTSGQP